MILLTKNYIDSRFIILLSVLILFSCSKKSEFDENILGTWRIKKANIHSVYSFRANGSWTSSNRIEGRFSKIVEHKGKLVGEWETTVSEDGIHYLVMTPNKVDDIKAWKVGETVKFEITGVDKKELNLLRENGKTMKLLRVRGKKASDDDSGEAMVKVKTGPIVVNLKKDRAHGKFRYLCIDLELGLDDIEDCDYIAAENKTETEEIVYHLHPKIREMAILFFSSLTYKDAKTLQKVKKLVDDFKAMLNPYFDGKISEILVVKVVVTSNVESVKEFENMYVPVEDESEPAE